MAVELLSAARGSAAPKRAVEEAPAPPPASVEEQPQPSYEPASEYSSTPEPEPEPTFSGAETIQNYEPAYEATPVEPASFVEAVPVEEPAGVFEDSPAPAEHPPTDDLEPPVWSPTPVEAAPPRRRYGQDAELPVEVHGDEERRLHNDARRFARLLISEIKLYNEQKVAEGRSEHDLYDRLKEYIDRSREMYDKRVKGEVANRYDYFHSELVNTLAEGDASKLGANYPGATVNA